MAWPIVKFNLNDDRERLQAARLAARVLKEGGIVIHPTDTCYGFAVDFKNKKSIAEVFRIKGRDEAKPFFIIVKDMREFRIYGSYHQLIKNILDAYPRHPLTFVVKRKKSLPAFLNPTIATIGIQITKCPFSQELLRLFGRPIVGTSANISNQLPCYSVAEIKKQFAGVKINLPLLFLDGGRLSHKKPSTVIAITGRNTYEILRAGDIKNISIPLNV